MTPALAAAGRRTFVSLTTFRRSGMPVSTAVWIAPAGDALVVTTGAGTGKAKRIRNDPRIELRESGPRGGVRPGAPVVLGTAELVTDSAEQDRLRRALAAKYGLQFTIAMAVERFLTRKGPGSVVLRITDR